MVSSRSVGVPPLGLASFAACSLTVFRISGSLVIVWTALSAIGPITPAAFRTVLSLLAMRSSVRWGVQATGRRRSPRWWPVWPRQGDPHAPAPTSHGREPAVHQVVADGDHRGVLPGEEGDEGGDLLGLGEAAHGDLGLRLLAALPRPGGLAQRRLHDRR